MNRQWLLFEVLGEQPVVVAHGHQLRNMIPAEAFLRRSRYLPDINVSIDATVSSGQSCTYPVDNGRQLVRTEPVVMTDGCVHGVHVWTGPPHVQPPPRPLPGAVVWNLTNGTATDTEQALLNSGLDPALEPTHERTLAAHLPMDLTPQDSEVLALTKNSKPGDTFSSTWDLTSMSGSPIRVSFVSRARLETGEDGTSQLICRAMNWSVPRQDIPNERIDLAHSIVDAMAQPGVHRAIVDVRPLRLLKWLDPPCPHFDWRGLERGRPLVHPDDRAELQRLSDQFHVGPVTGLLRLRAIAGAWTRMHLKIYRVKVAPDTYVGMVCVRLPTPAELHTLRSSPISTGAATLRRNQR